MPYSALLSRPSRAPRVSVTDLFERRFDLYFAPSADEIESSSNVARKEDVTRTDAIDMGDETIDDEGPVRARHATRCGGDRERLQAVVDLRGLRCLFERTKPVDELIVSAEIRFHRSSGKVFPQRGTVAASSTVRDPRMEFRPFRWVSLARIRRRYELSSRHGTQFAAKPDVSMPCRRGRSRQEESSQSICDLLRIFLREEVTTDNGTTLHVIGQCSPERERASFVSIPAIQSARFAP
jgi:hypothetical protein